MPVDILAMASEDNDYLVAFDQVDNPPVMPYFESIKVGFEAFDTGAL